MYKLLISTLLVLFFVSCQEKPTNENNPTELKIVKQGEGYHLTLNGQPFFVKGAVAWQKFDLIKSYGGNAIRTWARKDRLDLADSLGLYCLVNLPVKAERAGMDYNDTVAVKKQFEQVINLVDSFKNHPAVMMWALGNELEWVPPGIPCNKKVYTHLNELAIKIHAIDPNHPVLTTIGSVNKEVMHDYMELAPEMDMVGLNEYGNILEIQNWIREFDWNKPYIFTEWGPTGFWQMPKTEWEAPIEETSTQKAKVYRERYEKAILADNELCVGSFVFLWNQHQEKTHTWFGMFDKEWRENASVDVMRYEWTGEWPNNLAPVVDSMTIEGKTADENVYLVSGQTYSAEVFASDPDNDSLTFYWEFLDEIMEYHYGGQGEKKPEPMAVFEGETNSSKIKFRAPQVKGEHRLFVNIYDGNNHVSTANIPVFVK